MDWSNYWNAFNRRCRWAAVLGGLLVFTAGCRKTTTPDQPKTNTTTTQPSTSTTTPATTTTTQNNSPATAEAAAPEFKSPRELLSLMAAAYRDCRTYSDVGYVVQRYKLNGHPVEKRAPMVVAVERPNKIFLQAYGVSLTGNGKVLRGMVQGKDGFLELPAPSTLTVENLVTDATMQQELAGFGGYPSQLPLLLMPDFLNLLLPEKAQVEFLDDLNYGDRVCKRVKISNEAGSLALWIDARNLLLRRVDYPLERLQAELSKLGKVENLEQFADFAKAEFNAVIQPQSFEFALPSQAKLVKRILPDPAPIKPTALLGKAAPEFNYRDDQDRIVTPKTLHGKVTVLAYWGAQYVESRDALLLVQEAARRLTDKSNLHIVTVAIDGSNVTNAALREEMRAMGIELPIWRDTRQESARLLGIDGVPSLLVLGKDGVVEHHWPRLESNLPQALPAIVEKLLAGESTYQLTIRDYEQRLAEFERLQQMTATVPGSETVVPLPAASIAPATAPRSLQLEQLWTSSQLDIKQPGNLLLMSAAEGQRQLLALDGWDAVCVFDLSGKLLARHRLSLPEQTAVSMLRGAVNNKGEAIYVLYHPFDERRQLFVFDREWKPLLVFPPDADRGADRITDVRPADVDGDGGLELIVGYTGETGVQVVSLRGERIWYNRSAVRMAFQSAVGEPDAQGRRPIYVPNETGAVVPFDALGNASAPWNLPGVRILGMAAAVSDDGKNASLLGISPAADSSVTVVGMDNNGRPGWTYRLPAGTHGFPIDFVSATPGMGNDRCWLLAGPDGSIHLVGIDGRPIDSLSVGRQLRGLTGFRDGDGWVVFHATEGQLQAVRLSPPASTPENK